MATENDVISPIIDASKAGYQTLLVPGRALTDLHVNERREIRPLRDTLVRRAKEEFGMGSLSFNLALGPRWDWHAFTDEERRDYEQRFQTAKLPLQQGIAAAADYRTAPFERAFMLLASIQRSVEQGTDIPPLLILLEFGDDLAPDREQGQSSEWIIQMAEMLQVMATDYHRRRHQFLVIVTGTPERMDRRVTSCLHRIDLPQPDQQEKEGFLAALRNVPALANAVYEPGLDDRAVAVLTARTPNRSLEETVRAAAQLKRPITHLELVERKRADVVSLSEGTLSLLDTDRVRRLRLAGRTIEVAARLLAQWAARLKAGDPRTPMNVILAGAPSTAKTDLALLTAHLAQVPAYGLLSPKAPFVGQTERLVRLLFRIFKEMSPGIGVIDEISESFAMQRNSMNLDAGASAAVTAEMLSALSDNSRAGRTLLIATTNCPWRIGSAMASRFLFVPVLSAIEEDYPDILCAIAESVLPKGEWDAEDANTIEAARLFYTKGATPRLMHTLLSSKSATDGANPSNILMRAAQACAPQPPRDRAGAEYADLVAIRVCSDLEMLPWHGRVSNYPLPQYLQKIVSDRDGSIDLDHLDRRIEELKPLVNV